MLGWTKEAVEILIEEYMKHTCLYAVKSPLYHNRNARRDAEAKIARALCEVRPNTDSSEVKSKINGLRTQFNNKRNKVNKLKSGMSSDDVYRPSFMWYDRLLFLTDHIMPRSSRSNLDMSQLSEDGFTESTILNFEGSSMMAMDDIALDDDGVLVDLVQESDTVTPASSTKSVMNQPPQKEGTSIRKRKKVSPEDQVLASASQVLASMSASAVDSEEAFANYIACELHQIKNKRVKILTKQKIQNLLTEALLEEVE
ncbi:uncharacterized protein [Anabrus simplex]|uniref:uncharacterized protein n=1 Tax=Anabrus simplex TaxID=316456 RepID=UPI0035A291A9